MLISLDVPGYYKDLTGYPTHLSTPKLYLTQLKFLGSMEMLYPYRHLIMLHHHFVNKIPKQPRHLKQIGKSDTNR